MLVVKTVQIYADLYYKRQFSMFLITHDCNMLLFLILLHGNNKHIWAELSSVELSWLEKH